MRSGTGACDVPVAVHCAVFKGSADFLFVVAVAGHGPGWTNRWAARTTQGVALAPLKEDRSLRRLCERWRATGCDHRCRAPPRSRCRRSSAVAEPREHLPLTRPTRRSSGSRTARSGALAGVWSSVSAGRGNRPRERRPTLTRATSDPSTAAGIGPGRLSIGVRTTTRGCYRAWRRDWYRLSGGYLSGIGPPLKLPSVPLPIRTLSPPV